MISCQASLNLERPAAGFLALVLTRIFYNYDEENEMKLCVSLNGRLETMLVVDWLYFLCEITVQHLHTEINKFRAYFQLKTVVK